ncbi:uncharacterized protein TNCV_2530351 [Trichonephila clavipes]|nr:uncharacterized protein TNCV_2530351 [Trichonephila clavipes]
MRALLSAVRGMLYKGTLARNPQCSRRRQTDEANISTHVTVDQRAVHFLDEVIRSFTAMRNMCRSSSEDITFRRPLPSFRVDRCSSVQCFQAPITLELFRYT